MPGEAHPEPPGERADALVVLGLTGDLGREKLFPALAELIAEDRLDLPVVGVGRSDRTDDELLGSFHDAIAESLPDDDIDAVVERVDLRYVAGDAGDPATYDAVASTVSDAARPVVYAAVPPGEFAGVADGVARSALPDRTRLVLEKPFGDDERSAAELHRRIDDVLGAERLLIVDHFLAKPAIENLLTVRTTNALVANSLRPGAVERIDLTMSEADGVEGRGAFYDSVGAIRDVLQNHLLQMLALVTMDRPADDSDAAYHRARCELLADVRPIDPAEAVLGQYEGYRDHDGVADDSDVETYASVRVRIDREPWIDVPITITTGKRLAETRTAVAVTLRPVAPGASPNRIEFEIKPDAAVRLHLTMLDPETHTPKPVVMCAPAAEHHGRLGDYATMLDNAIAGASRHFATIEGIRAAWRIVDPLLVDRPRVRTYTPGGAGPLAE